MPLAPPAASGFPSTCLPSIIRSRQRQGSRVEGTTSDPLTVLQGLSQRVRNKDDHHAWRVFFVRRISECCARFAITIFTGVEFGG
ncbi:hypothetical protein VUR80DRAFT_3153 [Thermomyces stellatus]